MRYWFPDNIAVLCLGFMPSLFVMAQIYYYLHIPLLPIHQQSDERYSKKTISDPMSDMSQIIVHP